MRRVYPHPLTAASWAVLAAVVAGCAGAPTAAPPPLEPAAPAQVASLPPSFPPQDLVGRWGHTAYHRAEDRARTEAAARNQCKQPYVIGAGPSGGIIMHLADQKEAQELRLKGHPNRKNYIGPEGEPGGPQDREVVSFDGRVLVTRWMDPEVAGRYGFGVYVRCAPRA